jgi:plastocyanin
VFTTFRFTLRRGAILSLTLSLAFVLAACGGGTEGTDGGDGDGSTGGATVAVSGGIVELGADDLEFDASVIEAPAGEPFTIVFTNNETEPHNVAVYVSEGGEPIVVGNIIGEGETDEVEIEGLEAGTYYFRCDVHPEMEGTIVVEG